MAEGVLRELPRWTEAGRFGAFGVDDADNVYFEHQLLGSTVTTDSLGRSMRAAHAIAVGRQRRLPRSGSAGATCEPPHARHASRPSGWMCRSGAGADAVFVLFKGGRLPSWYLLSDEERRAAEQNHIDLMLSVAKEHGMRRLEGFRLIGRQHDWERFWVIEFPTLDGAEAWIEAEIAPPYGLVRLLRVRARAVVVGRAPRDVADIPAAGRRRAFRRSASSPRPRRRSIVGRGAVVRARHDRVTRRPATREATRSTSAGCSRSPATTG